MDPGQPRSRARRFPTRAGPNIAIDNIAMADIIRFHVAPDVLECRRSEFPDCGVPANCTGFGDGAGTEARPYRGLDYSPLVEARAARGFLLTD